jgi:prolyl-tRNA editing enzyme YbaK/EbsC (Cys-tRNA(Pro) deacylase)
MFKTQWTHKPVKLDESQQKRLDFEIADISENLGTASDLIFHTVMLTDDDNGAIVMVDGREGVEDTLFLTYYENPEWTTIDDFN